MANLTDGIGNAMQDDLMVLSGTTGNPYQAISVVGTTTINNTGKNLGENRAFEAVLSAKGTGYSGTASVTFVIQDSADNTTFNTVAAMPALDATTGVASQSTTGAVATLARRIFRTRTGRPYVRIHADVAGTTGGTLQVAVLLNPLPVPLNSAS
jgi:hypothetical protein